MTKTELVRLAREGDRDAFDILMTELVDHLYRIARLILRDFDSAEDAVQEALVRCWRDLPGLRDPDRFDAWLNRRWYTDAPFGTTTAAPWTYGGGQHNTVYILDVDGTRQVIDTMYLPGASAADRAELEQIVASIRFRSIHRQPVAIPLTRCCRYGVRR